MKNLGIGVRLIAGFAIVTFLAAFMGVFGYRNILEVRSSLEKVASRHQQSLASLANIRFAVRNIVSAQRSLLVKGISDEDRVRQYENIAAARKSYQDSMTVYEALPKSPDEREAWSEFQSALSASRAINDEIFAALKAYEADPGDESKHNHAVEYSFHTAKVGIDKLFAAVDKVALANTAASTEAESKVTIVADKAVRDMLIGVVLIPILALVLGLILTRSITRPLGKVLAVADDLAGGMLSSRTDFVRKDELGKVGRRLDTVAEVLVGLANGIEITAKDISRGFLRKRIDSSGFAGDYALLIEELNGLLDGMVALLDALPLPIMIRDQDRNMRFLNTTGSLGLIDPRQAEGRKCSGHFQTEDCENGQCACDRSFVSRKAESSSTVARPAPDLSVDINYNAVPFGADAVAEMVVDQTTIKQAQRKLLGVAAKAQKISEVVSASSEELSAQVEQSSKGAEQQSQRVTETAAAMEEMTATVSEVARNAARAAESADHARKKAQEGAGIVAEVVKGIGLVQTQALGLKTDMSNLGRQAEGIGQVMNVISDIADQTNLLALNAAIEAARAGDAGRGFAVVADEVRKLAEKTMTATKEVGEAINGIQTGTRKNIENVELAVATIDKSTAMAKRSGESLDEIVNLVDIATDQVRAIATASEQQSSVSVEIARSIEEVSTISSQTHEAMTEAAQAISELANQILNLKELIGQMHDAGSGQAALPA